VTASVSSFSLLRRLRHFLGAPHVPYFITDQLNVHWPTLYHLIVFGKTNVNTAEYWNTAWHKHGHADFRASALLTHVRRRILDEVPPYSSVLDVGCGVGELLAILHRDKSSRCFGVDISSIAISTVQERGFEGRVSALPCIPYPSDLFDVVVCAETLEHISDATGTVAEIARVVRRGGRTIISVPDGLTDREPVHVHRFTPEALQKLLSRRFHVSSVELIVDAQHRTLLAIGTKE